MVPTWTGKPVKMGKQFPVREKSGNIKQTGKVREFYPNTGKVRNFSEFFIFIFFSDILIEVLIRFLYFLNLLNKTLKKILENLLV